MRAERSVKFKKVVVAVPKDEKSIIAESISNKNIDIFEGSEDDVLSRYYECAKYFSAKNICRIKILKWNKKKLKENILNF